MKSYKLFLILSLFFSCEGEPKLEGSWYFNFNAEKAWDAERPDQLVIKTDSISFNYLYFNHWQTFPLKIENQKLKFNNFEIDYTFDKDTLVLNSFQKFTKKPFDRSKDMNEFKSDIKIHLPRLNDSLFELVDEDYYQILKHVGINPNTNKYSLLYNNEYIPFENLNDILDFGGSHSIPRDYFLFDENTKMKLIEMILIDSQTKNLLRVSFVNNIKLNYSDSIGLETNYQVLKKSIFPFVMSEEYFKNHDYNQNENVLPPPPPPPPKFKNKNYGQTIVVSLIKDNFYIKNTIISTKELIKILEDNVINNSPVISIYDLESNYSSFLELNAAISSVYKNKRDSLSLKTYGKILDNLGIERQLKIKNQIPIIHIWNYSIPHFVKIIEEDGTFYGLKIN